MGAVAFWCRYCNEIYTTREQDHDCDAPVSDQRRLYFGDDVRKAWEEFANWIGTDPYKRSMREVAIEARRRAKQW